MVTSGENARKVTEQCKFPCVVCKKGVDSNSMPSEAKERSHSTCVGRAMLHARGGCRGLPLLPMQHPEMADINFQS